MIWLRYRSHPFAGGGRNLIKALNTFLCKLVVCEHLWSQLFLRLMELRPFDIEAPVVLHCWG